MRYVSFTPVGMETDQLMLYFVKISVTVIHSLAVMVDLFKINITLNSKVFVPYHT